MKSKRVEELCGAEFRDQGKTYVCELPKSHVDGFRKGHRAGGVSWTDAGAQRLAEELAAKKGVQNVGTN